jgi:cellulose synthase (UDP-forming)
MVSTVLIPDWPRPFWGSFYENAVSAPLARSMLDLLLPKSLGFAVTPKGIVTQKAQFDWRSAKWTLLIAAITAFAIAKGLWEFHVFGIEKDAYFFNLAWASYNLLFLLATLMVAWERPQQRGEVRVACGLRAQIQLGRDRNSITARTIDLSLSGCALQLDEARLLPSEFSLEIQTAGEPIEVRGRLVYHERVRGQYRVGVEFLGLSSDTRQKLLLQVIAAPETWATVHEHEAQGYLSAAASFVSAMARFPRSHRSRSRRHPRAARFQMLRLLREGREEGALLRNLSPLGLGVVCTGSPPIVGASWRISFLTGPARWGRVVYTRRALPFVWSVGVELTDSPHESCVPEVELAA